MTLSINYSPSCQVESLNLQDGDWQSFLQTIDREDIGFFHVTERQELLGACEILYERFKAKKAFVQIGIGGSSLGPEMLVSALGDRSRSFSFINNIDPDELASQLSQLIPKESLFYFVSKSGSTAEMTAGLIIIQNWLSENGISRDQWSSHMVFATDPIKSDLKDLAASTGVSCLEIPSNVGGRFSVLTPVGILPALFAGIDVTALLSGANIMKKRLIEQETKSNELVSMATVVMDQANQGKNQTVLMPYSSKLRNLSFWFVQLWAESLGKTNANGQHVGLTPLPSYGATDQHSQVQLFMEGPKDKLTLFVRVESFENDFSLKSDLPNPSAKKLYSYKLGELMEAELQGTLKAMEQNDRPYILLSMSRLNAQNLGALIMLLESLTVLVGLKLNIDPFNQPGVEAGKLFAFEWLEKLKK